jgi:putative ABC transport system substrate-binding protein
MERRKFFLTGAAAALWPLAALAQQNERVARLGILLPAVAGDPQWQARLAAFTTAMARLGWTDRNLRIDTRWATNDAGEIRRQAAELTALAPDVILAVGTSSAGPLLQATHSIPIVFTIVPDPVGNGYVDSLSRPGGSATGFTLFDFSIGAKWLELLKEIAPQVTRVAVPRDSSKAAVVGLFAAMESISSSLKLELIPLNVRDGGEIERSLEKFARVPNGALVPAPSAAVITHRDLMIRLAERYKLPAVYWDRFFVAAGGLVSYGPDLVEEFRQAAGYVDRVLKGAKPADLPVQQPTKFELVINLKTAKALGLTVPQSLFARADEVIE